MKKMLMMVALSLMVSGCACCGLCGGGKKGPCGCKGEQKCESTIKKKCCGTCKGDKAKCTAGDKAKKCGCATTGKCCGTCK